MNYSIVSGNNDDVTNVCALARQCLPEAWSERSLRSSLAAGFDLLLAVKNDTLSGYLLSSHVLDEIHIMQLVVAPQHRRQGIASSLLQALVTSSAGMNSLQLEVRASNIAARRFYHKADFVVCGHRKNYYTTGSLQATEDAILMQRLLQTDNHERNNHE